MIRAMRFSAVAFVFCVFGAAQIASAQVRQPATAKPTLSEPAEEFPARPREGTFRASDAAGRANEQPNRDSAAPAKSSGPTFRQGPANPNSKAAAPQTGTTQPSKTAPREQTPFGEAAPQREQYPARPNTVRDGGVRPAQATVPADGRQPGAAQQGNQQPPNAPFVLTPQQQEALDRVLVAWETRGKNVRTFKCQFKRLEYDPMWGPTERYRTDDGKEHEPTPASEALGEIRFSTPDKGLFKVDTMNELRLTDEKTKKFQRIDMGADYKEQWVCDGKSIIQLDPRVKQVKVYDLPPELQGKAIANGPLPFLFGSDAATLKRRYFLRISTPPDAEKGQIWLQAYPRYQSDAANFSSATIILAEKGLAPMYLMVLDPSAATAKPLYVKKTVFGFEGVVENSKFDWIGRDHFNPATPRGWQRVTEPALGTAPSGGQANAQSAPGNERTAIRPAAKPR